MTSIDESIPNKVLMLAPSPEQAIVELMHKKLESVVTGDITEIVWPVNVLVRRKLVKGFWVSRSVPPRLTSVPLTYCNTNAPFTSPEVETSVESRVKLSFSSIKIEELDI